MSQCRTFGADDMGCLVLLLGLALTCNGTGDVPVEGVHLSWETVGWLLILAGIFGTFAGESGSRK